MPNKTSITKLDRYNQDLDLPLEQEATGTSPDDQVALSYIPYFKQNRRITIYNGDSSLDSQKSRTVPVVPIKDLKMPELVQKKDKYYLWWYEHGSLGGMTHAVIDPLKHGTKPSTVDKETGEIVEDTTRATRGVIKGLSKKSRNRMMDMCASIDKLAINEKDILFLTITYGKDFKAENSVQSKKELNSFNTSLKYILDKGELRKNDGSRASNDDTFWIWRIEEQESGRLHYHMCIFGTSFICSHWIRDKWEKITGVKGRIDVQQARYWNATSAYFSKTLAYLTKDEHHSRSNSQMGRVWGVVNRKAFNSYKKLTIKEVDRRTYFSARRTMVKLVINTNLRKRKWTKKYANFMKRILLRTDKKNHKRYLESHVFRDLVDLYSTA